MDLRLLKTCLVASVAVFIAACGGGGGGGYGGGNNGGTGGGSPQPQTINFLDRGPVNVLLGSATTNTASGGTGTGATTYASSNPTAVTVDQTTGAATAVGVGTAVITATKAADTNYLQAATTYTVHSQTADTVGAFIGGAGAEVFLPANANGKQISRARVEVCSDSSTVATCPGAESIAVNGAVVNDPAATLTTQMYYAIKDGSSVGTPIDFHANRFSSRVGHAAVRFNNRYWVIGGGEPIFPSATTTFQHVTKSDVWSSADGKSWKLETADGGFGARWFHQAVVFGGKIWIFSGSSPGQSPPWYTDAWSSVDGVTWTRESTDLFLSWWSTDLNVVVFGGEILAVSGGRVYTYSVASHTFVPKTSGIVVTGSSQGRTNATLTVYNNQLWYIGGKLDFPFGSPPSGDAMNDVWRSSDGVTWTQVLPNGHAVFQPRYRHASFVVNGRLWIVGGQGAIAGVATTTTADAWSTTDGTTWTQENINGLARTFFVQPVQEAGRATLIGGIHYSYANNVWQTTDGASWSELTASAQFSSRQGSAVAFNGQMWIVAGNTIDGAVSGGETNQIWRSSDGLNWSRVATTGPLFAARAGHGLVVFNNRLWVIGGSNNSMSLDGTPPVRFSDVWSSADGVAWRGETSAAAFQARSGHATVAFAGRLWVIAGYADSGSVNDVWSSQDGVSWNQVTANAAFSARAGHRVAVFNNQMLLIGGGIPGASGTNEIWRSTDGAAWTLVTPNGPVFVPRVRHAMTVMNGRVYVIGGASSDVYATSMRYNDIWSSADGSTWRQDSANAAFSPRGLHAVIVYNGDLWLIGGLGMAFLNDVWRSSDGANWRVGFSHTITAP